MFLWMGQDLLYFNIVHIHGDALRRVFFQYGSSPHDRMAGGHRAGMWTLSLG